MTENAWMGWVPSARPVSLCQADTGLSVWQLAETRKRSVKHVRIFFSWVLVAMTETARAAMPTDMLRI